MKKHYVYELINLYGSVEYVGETLTPKGRVYSHTKRKPNGTSSRGLFYGRQDIIMNIVAEFDTLKEARRLETKLKLEYGLEPPERNRAIANFRKASDKNRKALLVYKLDGTFVGEYPSRDECYKTLNLTRESVSRVCNGQWKHTKGYVIKNKQI